jgi:hypothetical protein
MRTNLWFFPLLVVIGACPFACSDSETSSGTTSEQGKPCEREEECDDGDPCTFDLCIDKRCQNNQADDGAQDGDVQTDGDCQELRCEGGESIVANDDDDPPEDPDESDCMVPVCVDGSADMAPAEVGADCDVDDNLRGACDDAGTCSCSPATPGVTVYVDGENGTDATANGAGRGGCAYATVEYALSQANGEIVLTDDLYDDTNVTFPITLSGNQRLRCDYDYNNDQFATTISGSGTFGAGTAAVVFTGATNRVVRCLVDGGGAADTAIVVDSAGGDNFETRHEIRITRVTNATTGIELTANGNAIRIEESEIQNNATNGILLTGADKNGDLRNNSFSANGTDIVCTDPNPSLDGDGNGGPTCSVCQNCPF